MTLYYALGIFLLALFLFWLSGRQRKASGLPGGRIIYADTRSWGKLSQPLFYAPLGLTGKPDYLVEQIDGLIPVEVKSGRTPLSPHDSHLYQLAAYCLLVEKTYGKRPPYGIIHYRDRDFAVDYTPELEASLLELLAGMKQDEARGELARSHTQSARCVRCGYRSVCDQSLA